MSRPTPAPIPETVHDAVAMLRAPFEVPPLYQAICKCGWRGKITVRATAKSEADWHNDRDGEPVANHA